MCIGVAYVIVIKWTYLRHAYHVLRNIRLPERKDFEHDVMILHAELDVRLAIRVEKCLRRWDPGLRTIKSDDVHPNKIESAEITNMMDKSWKVHSIYKVCSK